MSIIDDFKDINRRMNRKPEPVAKADAARLEVQQSIPASCSFRYLRDDEAFALIEQYDRDATDCAVKRPRGF